MKYTNSLANHVQLFAISAPSFLHIKCETELKSFFFNFQIKKASVFATENPQTCKPVKFVDFCAALPQSGTELSVNGTKSGKIGHRQSIPLRLSLSPSAALFIAPPHVTQLCYGLLEAGILTKTAANICNSPTAGGGDQT